MSTLAKMSETSKRRQAVSQYASGKARVAATLGWKPFNQTPPFTLKGRFMLESVMTLINMPVFAASMDLFGCSINSIFFRSRVRICRRLLFSPGCQRRRSLSLLINQKILIYLTITC